MEQGQDSQALSCVSWKEIEISLCTLPCAKHWGIPGNMQSSWGPGRQVTLVLQRPSFPSLRVCVGGKVSLRP